MERWRLSSKWYAKWGRQRKAIRQRALMVARRGKSFRKDPLYVDSEVADHWPMVTSSLQLPHLTVIQSVVLKTDHITPTMANDLHMG